MEEFINAIANALTKKQLLRKAQNECVHESGYYTRFEQKDFDDAIKQCEQEFTTLLQIYIKSDSLCVELQS